MAAVVKGKDLGGVEGEAPKTHRIRITLSSQVVEALEKVSGGERPGHHATHRGAGGGVQAAHPLPLS